MHSKMIKASTGLKANFFSHFFTQVFSEGTYLNKFVLMEIFS